MVKGILLYVLMVSVVFAGWGCAVALVGAGAAGYGYVRGELKADLTGSVDSAYNATVKALDKLGLPVISKEKDALGAKVVARNVEDKKVGIKLKRVSEKITEVRIRIGIFGDQTQSIAIMDEIKKYL